MASQLVARSKDLAFALSRAGAYAAQPLAGARALSSLPRYPAAAAAPSQPSPPVLGKILGYEPTSHLSSAQFLPFWFSTIASNASPMQKAQETCKSVAGMERSEVLKVMEGTSPKVVAFSPVEAAIAKPRSSPLTIESSKGSAVLAVAAGGFLKETPAYDVTYAGYMHPCTTMFMCESHEKTAFQLGKAELPLRSLQPPCLHGTAATPSAAARTCPATDGRRAD
ncbi:hypothetical protein E2562_028158 [Oryza meyeriana var. granulata]|uniref:Uncharacterized protein n=1 Tax=Oryza meyeriana var. granulata TaxID=110450 RepID=A0A6G1D8T2_9ORYZ|nr:hypothetical protein E2562_028158 [Oryza meyeriana var. granulata]